MGPLVDCTGFIDYQTSHFANKFKPGDRVIVRVSYFADRNIEPPILFNRYGTISEIKYEGFCESTGINVSYNVKMDNGIDLAINNPAYILPGYSYYCLPYDLLNTNTNDLVSDAANKFKEFIDTKILKKEKQMVNTSIYRVIFNDPATIILWNTFHYEDKEYEIDGKKLVQRILVRDKTVVKCAKGEKFSKYNGFCAAVTKRIFETNSAIQHIIREAQDNSDAKKLVKEIVNTGKKVKAQRENAKNENKKGGSKKNG